VISNVMALVPGKTFDSHGVSLLIISYR
jgi:hypothetical protein